MDQKILLRYNPRAVWFRWQVIVTYPVRVRNGDPEMHTIVLQSYTNRDAAVKFLNTIENTLIKVY